MRRRTVIYAYAVMPDCRRTAGCTDLPFRRSERYADTINSSSTLTCTVHRPSHWTQLKSSRQRKCSSILVLCYKYFTLTNAVKYIREQMNRNPNSLYINITPAGEEIHGLEYQCSSKHAQYKKLNRKREANTSPFCSLLKLLILLSLRRTLQFC